MLTNSISRSMIVQSMDKNKGGVVVLTNLSDERLQAGPGPAIGVPELTPIPLSKSLEELWGEKCPNQGLEMTDRKGRNVRIISNSRSGTEYNFVGLVGGTQTPVDEVHCFNKDGKCEDGAEYDLYSYPEERFGWIAIWRGSVTPYLSDSCTEALDLLRSNFNITQALDPKEVFLVQVSAWVDSNEIVI